MNKSILIFLPNWLGDAVFATPFIRTVQENFPKARIGVICVSSVKGIIENNPRVDEIILYDEKGGEETLFGKLRFVSALRKKRFNIVFILRPSLTRTLLMLLAGVRKRIGHYHKKSNLLLTRTPNPEPRTPNMHRADYYLQLAELYGMKIQPEYKECEVFVREEDEETVRVLLEKRGISYNEPLIAINPGANWEPKRWQKEKFAELAKRLVEESHLRVIITGAPKDYALGEWIVQRAGFGTGSIFNLCGGTDLKQLAALFKRAGLVLSNDSGPLHIAAGAGVNVIGLYGPTSSFITGPYRSDSSEQKIITLHKDVGCDIPCYRDECVKRDCMAAIEVEDVLEAVGKVKGYENQ